MNVDDCVKKGFLRKISPDDELAEKEFSEATYDLEKAKRTFDDGDYKWTIIKSYYSMFHAAKGLLFKIGYVEKKHIGVISVLEMLEKEGKIRELLVTYFKSSLSAREDADYHYIYSKEIAKYELEVCREFVDEILSCKL